MTEKQAFELLAKSGNSRDARVVLDGIRSDRIRPRLNISFIESIRIRRAAQQLRRGVPVAKIIGRKWFYGMEFETGRHTLDPRPESETLVDAVPQQISNTFILDLGTGTGNLICALVKNLPNATGVGIDKSLRACRVARRNVRRLGLSDRIKIIRGDFCKVQTGTDLFDIIVSNPPYIAVGDMRVNRGAQHDPKLALYAGADGLNAYRAIARTARAIIKPGGRIFLEIGAGQGNEVRKIFKNAGWRFIDSKNDLAGIERVVVFSNTVTK